jgi:flagellin-like hook-associated protein FlgL
VKVELASTDLAFANTAGQFSLSHDGLFMADVPSAGTIRVTNLESHKSQTFTVGTSITVDQLTFSSDNLELFYVDTVENAVRRLNMEPGDTPSLHLDEKIHAPTGALGFAGLSLDGGSHRSHVRIHNGPDGVQESFFQTGDARLLTLGLSRTSVASVDQAKHALGKVQSAIDELSIQRARLGAEASRINFSYEANLNYADNIMQAEAILRDTDVVKESANLAEYQVRHQAAIALLAQANQAPRAALSLLQR